MGQRLKWFLAPFCRWQRGVGGAACLAYSARLLPAILLATLFAPVWQVSGLQDFLPFPNDCIIGRNITLSPIRMSRPMGPFNVTDTDSTYCFNITSDPSLVVPTADCANMNSVRKLEIVIGLNCSFNRRVVPAATANGYAVPVGVSTLAWNGTSYGILTVKRISKVIPTVPPKGISVCMALSRTRAGGACSTPASLCYGGSCVFQITSGDFGCCPTGEVPKN